MHLYKPNKNSSGSACQVQYNRFSDCLYISLVKQTGWNPQGNGGKGTGTFKNSPVNILAKFSKFEIGSFLDAIERNVEFKFFHSSNMGSTSGSFQPYERNGRLIGFSLSIFQKDTENNQQNAVIGFTFSETIVLRELLLQALRESAIKEFDKSEEYSRKKFQESNQNSQKDPDDGLNWDPEVIEKNRSQGFEDIDTQGQADEEDPF